MLGLARRAPESADFVDAPRLTPSLGAGNGVWQCAGVGVGRSAANDRCRKREQVRPTRLCSWPEPGSQSADQDPFVEEHAQPEGTVAGIQQDNQDCARYRVAQPLLLHASSAVAMLYSYVFTNMVVAGSYWATGDFAGATQLVLLILAGNRIVSVAAEAFSNLKALQFTPEEFEPTNADGTPYRSSYGIGKFDSGALVQRVFYTEGSVSMSNITPLPPAFLQTGVQRHAHARTPSSAR